MAAILVAILVGVPAAIVSAIVAFIVTSHFAMGDAGILLTYVATLVGGLLGFGITYSFGRR